MKYISIALVMAWLFACSRKIETESGPEQFAQQIGIYFEGSAEDAEIALWTQIRLLEDNHFQEQNKEFSEEGISYHMFLCYTRLALIAEAKGEFEASDALFSFSLRHMSEALGKMESNRESHTEISRKTAQFQVDSLEHSKDVQWRKELNFLPTIFFPDYVINSDGKLEQVAAGNVR